MCRLRPQTNKRLKNMVPHFPIKSDLISFGNTSFVCTCISFFLFVCLFLQPQCCLQSKHKLMQNVLPVAQTVAEITQQDTITDDLSWDTLVVWSCLGRSHKELNKCTPALFNTWMCPLETLWVLPVLLAACFAFLHEKGDLWSHYHGLWMFKPKTCLSVVVFWASRATTPMR